MIIIYLEVSNKIGKVMVTALRTDRVCKVCKPGGSDVVYKIFGKL